MINNSKIQYSLQDGKLKLNKDSRALATGQKALQGRMEHEHKLGAGQGQSVQFRVHYYQSSHISKGDGIQEDYKVHRLLLLH